MFKIKAPLLDKSDITIKVHDFSTGLTPTLGFSIKSRSGKPSTLLNAGVNTNFIFEIGGNINDKQMKYINNMFVENKENGKYYITLNLQIRFIK